MPTANSIIESSLRLLQVKEANESISAAEGADGLSALNELLDSWTNEDLMQSFRKELTFSFVAGQGTYTIGATGDIVETRPVSIENAFTRDSGQSDWPIIEVNNDQFAKIILKQTQSTYPYYFFYRPDFPLGEINFWPVPGANLELHLNVRDELAQFTDINTNLTFPPGYVRALRYNLAVDIAPEYRSDIPPLIIEVARTSKERIKDTNNKNIPELVSDLVWWGGFDSSLARFGGAGSGGGPVTDVIWTGTGSSGIIMTGSGSASVIVTGLGTP